MGDVRMVRSIMTEMGIKKTPDRSLIEVEGKFYEFLVADGSHPQSESIKPNIFAIQTGRLCS
jgi:hypothetical protein